MSFHGWSFLLHGTVTRLTSDMLKNLKKNEL